MVLGSAFAHQDLRCGPRGRATRRTAACASTRPAPRPRSRGTQPPSATARTFAAWRGPRLAGSEGLGVALRKRPRCHPIGDPALGRPPGPQSGMPIWSDTGPDGGSGLRRTASLGSPAAGGLARGRRHGASRAKALTASAHGRPTGGMRSGDTLFTSLCCTCLSLSVSSRTSALVTWMCTGGNRPSKDKQRARTRHMCVGVWYHSLVAAAMSLGQRRALHVPLMFPDRHWLAMLACPVSDTNEVESVEAAVRTCREDRSQAPRRSLCRS